MVDTPKTNTPLPKSLATVAYLKARFDERSDQLDIFLPLLLDVLARSNDTLVTVALVQELIARHHSIAMPRDTVATLLNRAKRSGAVVRDGGAYRIDPVRLPKVDVRGAQAHFAVDIDALASDFLSMAQTHGLTLSGPDEALSILTAFLDEYQIGFLLGSDLPPLSTSGTTEHAKMLAARFTADSIAANSRSAATIRQLVEGIVVYRAAFLPDPGSRRKDFAGLRVYFDSGFVRQAIGYEGDAPRILAREIIDVLKSTGASCLVFDTTLFEIDRILAVHEHKIGSEAGRRELWQTPMTRHFLTNRYSPGDVRQLKALLRSDVAEAGISIAGLPRRDRRHMLIDEGTLAAALSNEHNPEEPESRVRHDVDCIVGVVTLRGGHRAVRLEDAKAVFVTTSALLTQNATRCYREAGESGISPVVHIRAITNAAWLKRPRLSKDFKDHELVGLCRAALQPSREIWAKFLAHLDRLVSEGKLTSEEQALIVASEMADVYLSEAELDDIAEGGPDATCLDEVVARVKAKYAAEIRKELEIEGQRQTDEGQRALAEARQVGEELRRETEIARQDAATVRETLRQRKLRAENRAKTIASWLCKAVLGFGYLLIGLGFVEVFLSHHFSFGWIGVTAAVAVLVFLLLELIGILGHFRSLITTLEASLAGRLKKLLEYGD